MSTEIWNQRKARNEEPGAGVKLKIDLKFHPAMLAMILKLRRLQESSESFGSAQER